MLRQWNRFFRKAVDAPTLAVSKANLDKALRNLAEWEMSLPNAGVGGGFGLDDLQSLFQPLTSYDSLKSF